MDMMSGPAMAEWQFNPPAEVLESKLFNAGGYFVVSGLFDELTLQALTAEAEASRAESTRQVVAASDGTNGRGGSPARAFRAGRGRDLHWGLHGSPEMAEAIKNVCGTTVAATGSGTFTYYDEPGDFLALHRDVLQCDITLITCLTPRSTDTVAGELTIYPDHIREPLSVVRAAGRERARTIALDRGHTAIILGGIVPHEVTPTAPGQERIVAINCYRIETAAAPQEAELELAHA